MAHLGTKLVIFLLVTQTMIFFVGQDMGAFETTNKAEKFKQEVQQQSGDTMKLIQWEDMNNPVVKVVANTVNTAAGGLSATIGAIKQIGSILFAEWAVLPKTGIPTALVWIFGTIMSFLKFVAVISFARGRGF